MGTWEEKDRPGDGLVGARKRGAEVGRKRGEGGREQLGCRVCDLLNLRPVSWSSGPRVDLISGRETRRKDQ